MITKERLLAGLHEIIYVEEGMVTMFASFTKVLVKMEPELGSEKKKEIEKLLSRLHKDSTRHKKTTEEMSMQIGKDPRDEF